MKRFLVLFIFVFFVSTGFASYSHAAGNVLSLTIPPGGSGHITGVVIDSLTKQPVEFATVSVFPKGSKQPVDGAATDGKGSFKINNLAEGTYYISISFIGYREKIRNNIVISPGQNSVNIGVVRLRDNSVALKGVTVTAQRPLVENKIDKMVFNAEQDISSQSGLATDVLRKVPQVAVDVDGNVELRGSTDVRVLINGKPSTILATSLADALQSIPANQIKSIEVITNPSAKYDAEGSGGIINIILKKSTAKGVTGSINLTGGSRQENGSFNLNARKGTFGVNLGISGNAVIPSNSFTNSSKTVNDSTLASHPPISTQNQFGSGNLKRNGYNGSFGIDWDISPKDNLTSTVRYNNFGFFTKGPTYLQSETFDPTTGATLTNDSTRREQTSYFNVNGVDWSTDFKRTFNDLGKELDVSYQLSLNSNKNNYVQQTYVGFNGTSPQSITQGNNLGKSREQDITIDYTNPFSKTTKLELGAKATLRYIYSNSQTFVSDSNNVNMLVLSNQLSNKFTYNQNFFAGYALLSFKAFNYLDFYTGMRIEHTNQNSSSDSYLGPINSDKDYNNYIPSITISRTINERNSIKVSYTERIRRPNQRDVNPFINAVDPNNISAGNPFLSTEITQTAEITYNTFIGKGSSLNIAGYYRYTGNDVESFVSILPSYTIGDSTYRNVSYTTNLNIGRQKVAGLNLFGAVPFTSKFTVRGNVNLFINRVEEIQGPLAPITTFNYRLNLNGTYNISPTFAAEFFGFFNSPRRTIQGTSPSFSFYNFGLRKQIWKKKGSIAFTAAAPFSKYHDFSSTVNTAAFSTSSVRKVPLQSFGLNFTYQFGKINYDKNTKKGGGGDRQGGGADDQGGGDDQIGDLGGGGAGIGAGGGGNGAPGAGGAGGGRRGNGGGQRSGRRPDAGAARTDSSAAKKDSSASYNGIPIKIDSSGKLNQVVPAGNNVPTGTTAPSVPANTAPAANAPVGTAPAAPAAGGTTAPAATPLAPAANTPAAPADSSKKPLPPVNNTPAAPADSTKKNPGSRLIQKELPSNQQSMIEPKPAALPEDNKIVMR